MPTKLGQNFLTDRSIVEKIVSAADLKKEDFILEIGPGEGILTENMVERAKKVVAIEIDGFLASKLKERFGKSDRIQIIEGDILSIDLKEVIPPNQDYRVIANIPYYITAKIIRLFLERDDHPKDLILMVQKEVAERIIEKPGKMSLLSVSVQYFADPDILFEVSRESFSPVPEVDSAVIRITPRASKPNKEETSQFFRLARSGFSSKRKTLLNNLSNSLHLEKSAVLPALKKSGLSENVRAQELSIEDWERLGKNLE